MEIFVGNLSYRAKENDIQKLLEDYGTVNSVKIITDRETGRSRGFAFVEIDDEGGQRAISELNETDFLGRKIFVKVANPRQ